MGLLFSAGRSIKRDKLAANNVTLTVDGLPQINHNNNNHLMNWKT